MARNELWALGDLAADALDVSVTTPVQGMHEAIAGRVFRAIGPASAPARVVHDAIASSLYRAFRSAGAATAAAAGAAGKAIGTEPKLFERSSAGRLARAAVNAVAGDRLEERENDIRIVMAVRVHGDDVAIDRDALGAAFPDATPRIAVFVHGLGEDELAWRLGAARHGRATYGSRLHDDEGFIPVYLRYNTGLRISENGRRLASLLEALVERWPIRVEELTLIGHSMGGLVARSAMHDARTAGRAWLHSTRHVIFLGSPHLGAPLEKLVNAGSWALGLAPEARPLAGVLNARSVGIKDLRFGYVCDEDWQGCEPDSLLKNTRRSLPPHSDITFHHVAATLTAEHSNPLGAIAGDLLVRYASATGRGIGAVQTTRRHFGNRTHFHLLNDPEIYRHLRECLQG